MLFLRITRLRKFQMIFFSLINSLWTFFHNLAAISVSIYYVVLAFDLRTIEVPNFCLTGCLGIGYVRQPYLSCTYRLGHLVSVFLLVLVLAQMSCYLICYAMIYCIRFFRWLFMLFYRKYVNWIFDYKAVCIIDNKYNNKWLLPYYKKSE